MTSLTRAAVVTRKIIRYSIFFLIFLIIGRSVLSLGIKIYNSLFPAPPPAPTVTWGKLPKLPFPEKTKATNITYSLETPEGGLPVFANQAKVFFMPKPPTTHLALDYAKEKARSLGYSEEAKEKADPVYQFSDPVRPATLEFNIITNVFSISYDLKADNSVMDRRPPAPEVAASTIRSYLTSAKLLPADLTGPTTHQFLRFEDTNLVPAVSLSEANLVKIFFFRKSYDELPSVTPDPISSNVWFMMGNVKNQDRRIISGEYHYFAVDESQFSTYPLKSAQTAWDEMNKGNAYFASLGYAKEGETVVIRRVYLGYYDPGIYTEFFQPVYVFEGDRDFVAYVPAISTEYYGE